MDQQKEMRLTALAIGLPPLPPDPPPLPYEEKAPTRPDPVLPPADGIWMKGEKVPARPVRKRHWRWFLLALAAAVLAMGMALTMLAQNSPSYRHAPAPSSAPMTGTPMGQAKWMGIAELKDGHWVILDRGQNKAEVAASSAVIWHAHRSRYMSNVIIIPVKSIG